MSVSGGPVVDGTEAILTLAGEGVRSGLAAVERRLAELAQEGGPLAQPAGLTISAGGKRLRPLLVFLSAPGAAPDPGAPVGGDGSPRSAAGALVRAALAVELVHSATLVHDDVLDGAALRRGRPTVVAASGRATAVATGDLMFSRAFAELARNGSPDQLRALASATTALARGELLQREDAWRVVGVERYLERCRHKTASLFEAACRLGELAASPAAGGDGAIAEQLGRFGQRIGVAFQVLDDVLDVAGPPERTGKAIGADLLDGTVTLPLILASRRDPELANLDPRSIRGAAAAEETCGRILASGALEEAREYALRLVADAKSELSEGFSPRRRELLELVADAVVARYA